jgi:hypothetical protein
MEYETDLNGDLFNKFCKSRCKNFNMKYIPNFEYQSYVTNISLKLFGPRELTHYEMRHLCLKAHINYTIHRLLVLNHINKLNNTRKAFAKMIASVTQDHHDP